MIKLILTYIVAIFLDYLLRGQLEFLNKKYDVVTVYGRDQNFEEVNQREGVKTIVIEIKRKIVFYFCRY